MGNHEKYEIPVEFHIHYQNSGFMGNMNFMKMIKIHTNRWNHVENHGIPIKSTILGLKILSSGTEAREFSNAQNAFKWEITENLWFPLRFEARKFLENFLENFLGWFQLEPEWENFWKFLNPRSDIYWCFWRHFR